MKRLYLILVAATAMATASCTRDIGTETKTTPETREVEIEISTSGGSSTRGTTADTRKPLDGSDTDAGSVDEQTISTLDLLVFDDTGYLYRREAYKVTASVNTYRVALQESSKPLDVYLFANVRDILTDWGAEPGHVGQPWTTVRTQLVDTVPARLVWQDTYEPLPMYGYKLGQSIDPAKAPTKWGEIELRRSVASVDVYVEDKTSVTDVFRLTGLLAWYAPSCGYLAATEDAANATPHQQYLTPSTMTSTLNGIVDGRMHARSVRSYTVNPTTENGETVAKDYTGVACQMYLYDNPYVTRANGGNKRPTRVIVAGEYKKPGGSTWEVAYYPLDIVYSDVANLGKYRPLIRNWKYEFKVTSVNGPGYDTPEEAAEGAPVDLNVELIPWNKDDVAIGVKGHYYVSMASKNAILWRNMYDTETLGLSYEVLDDDPVGFTYNFLNPTADNIQTNIMNGDEIVGIMNNYFLVEMTHTPGIGGGTASFIITARQDMPDGLEQRQDFVVVRFRDLEFTITITQINRSENDWGDGGDIPVDF